MGLSALIRGLRADNKQTAFRPSQLYDAAVGGGVYPMFAVRDGPILALALVGMHRAASGGATTLAVTVTGGIAMDAGAIAINGAVGTIVDVGLGVAVVQAGAAVALPLTTVLLHPPKGTVIGLQPLLAPTFIIGTYAVSTVTMEWCLLYTALSPRARVTLA
jgi:hypothetical protein